jgi:peptidoglycan pentaglycine glycine transferase (the first glycine)
MEHFTGSAQSWNQLAASLPMPHLLQSWEWSQVKARFGWQPMPFVWTRGGASSEVSPLAAAMILKRTIPVAGFAKKMCVLYIPKGPNLDWADESLRTRILENLQEFARKQGAIFIKMDPDVPLGTGVPGSPDASESDLGSAVKKVFTNRGWHFSQDQIQFRNTVLIDLVPGEAEMLARMKQKTRYNLNLAQKKGVSIRRGTPQDFSLLYRMYAETSVRDGFLIRGEEYYQTVWQVFNTSEKSDSISSLPSSESLIAEVEGEPIAAISVFYFARQATYLFGMSRDKHREKMPKQSGGQKSCVA